MPPKTKSRSPSPVRPRRSLSPTSSKRKTTSPSKKSPTRRRRPEMSLKPFIRQRSETTATQVRKISPTAGRFPSFYYSQVSPTRVTTASSSRRSPSPTIMGQPIRFANGNGFSPGLSSIPSSTGGSSGRGRFYRSSSPTF